jgi:CO/xanthine dehydrogenase Mo-binding subunit
MSDDEKLYLDLDLPIPETPDPGEPPEPWDRTNVVGRAIPRVDGYERLSGSAVYPSDVILPNMLYGAILRCPHPHAKIKKVQTDKAAAMPGVHAVITGRTPEADLGWRYAEGVTAKLFDPTCRFEGEAVAAVAAETPYQARDALEAIEVEYEVLPFVVDERDAQVAEAPKVHTGGNRLGEPQVYTRGDIAKGFTEADIVLEQEYRTACEIHTPMELHGCVANWDGRKLTIWESTQGVFVVQLHAARALGLPASRVRVIGSYVGGGFGSKLELGKYTVIAAVLAAKTARPVKLFLSREETLLCTGNRPANNMKLKAGVKKDGALTALEFTGDGSGGAYSGRGVTLLDWLVKDLYLCSNVRTELTNVYIHAGPARPMRGPGHPQGAWALEQMMDALAEAIDMDPVQLRLKNIPRVSQARDGQPPYTTTGLQACLEEGARTFGWEEARRVTAETRAADAGGGGKGMKGPHGRAEHLKRGVGMGACLWVAGAGGPPSTVIVKLFQDGSVNLNLGASDLGTGTKTVMAMIVAEELGVDPNSIQIENADTATTQFTFPSGGSKTAPTESPAVRDAAIKVKQQLLEMAAEDLQLPLDDLDYRGQEIVSRSDPEKTIAITAISGLQRRFVVVGVGYRGPNREDKATCPFGAQFCEVEVNVKTGEVTILRFLGAHESGRVMSRKTYDNQVYGGIAMGIGLAMTEARVLDRGQTGKLCNRNWHDYKLPTAMDVPLDIVSLPIEMPDPEANTAGCKGLGEPVTIPTAAAVANAVYDAVGVRMTATPITPLQLRRELARRFEEG